MLNEYQNSLNAAFIVFKSVKFSIRQCELMKSGCNIGTDDSVFRDSHRLTSLVSVFRIQLAAFLILFYFQFTGALLM